MRHQHDHVMRQQTDDFERAIQGFGAVAVVVPQTFPSRRILFGIQVHLYGLL